MRTRTFRHPPRASRLVTGIAAAVPLVAAPAALHAQEPVPVPKETEPAPDRSDVPRRATGAFLGLVGGAFAGALLAAPVAGVPESTLDIFVGAAVGSAVFAPLGAHFFDDDPGSVIPPVLATAALTALLLTLDEGGSELLVVLPVGQIVTATFFGRGPS